MSDERNGDGGGVDGACRHKKAVLYTCRQHCYSYTCYTTRYSTALNHIKTSNKAKTHTHTKANAHTHDRKAEEGHSDSVSISNPNTTASQQKDVWASVQESGREHGT